MSRKLLGWYEAQYLRALAYAQVYGCNLRVEQFAGAHVLESDEVDQLRAHPESHEVGVTDV